MALDYAPVGVGDDEDDELLKRGIYAPVAPVMPPSTDSSYSPVGSTDDLEARADRPRAAAPAVASGSAYAPVGTADLESRLSVPRERVQDAARPDSQPPQWKDFAPVQPHGFKGFLEGAGAMISPGFGRYMQERREAPAEAAYKAANEEYERPLNEQAKEAETEKNTAQAEKDRAAAGRGPKESWEPILSGDKTIAGFRNTATGELAGPNSPNLTPEMKDIFTAAKPAPAKPDTATQNKENFQHGIGVLRGEGLLKPGDVADPKKIASAIGSSTQLQDEEKNAMVGYLAANPTPSTSVTVHNEQAAGSQDAKDRNTKALIDDGNGKTRLATVAEAKAAGVDFTPVKDPETVTQTGRMANTIQIALNRLADPDKLKLFDNPGARAIIATATDDTAARQFGAVIPGVGGLMIPVPGGVSKFIDSALQNSSLPGKDAAAVKEYLAAYWSAREAMMNLMRLQSGGKQGARGQFQADAAIQQLPGGKTPDAATAKLQMMYAQEGLDQYRAGIPDELPGFKKEKSFLETGKTAEPGGKSGGEKKGEGNEAPEGTRIQVGDKIQVKRDGKWVPEQP
jgi:hypothetical protein